MADWPTSIVLALLGLPAALFTFVIGRRTARSQETAATAATATARAAGEKAAADVLDAHTREWDAMFRTSQALATAASAQADTVKAQLAEARLQHQQDMVAVNAKLEANQVALGECHALTCALEERMRDVMSATGDRLESLERGQNGG